MLATHPIMLKVPYSNLSLLFVPRREPKLFTTYLYLIRRPKGRIVGVLVMLSSSGEVHVILGGVMNCSLRWLFTMCFVFCFLGHLRSDLGCIIYVVSFLLGFLVGLWIVRWDDCSPCALSFSSLVIFVATWVVSFMLFHSYWVLNDVFIVKLICFLGYENWGK